MIAVGSMEAALRTALCKPLEVTPVPLGYHVATGFILPGGDVLDFYLVEDDSGACWFEDDGTTLPDAIASGFDMRSASREGMLRAILAQEGAKYGVDDYVIRSEPINDREVGPGALRFISALIRTRDLFTLSRENTAASFADDIRKAISETLPENMEFDEEAANEPGAPDFVLRNSKTHRKAARIFAAGSDIRLLEAMVDYQATADGDSPVIAVVDRRKNKVSEKRFNRATNIGLPIAVVDDGGKEWISRVLRLVAS